MTTPNLILYGQNQFGPKHIQTTMPLVRGAGFTTIVFGMFHIGNEVEKKPGMKEGDIIFNGDEPLVVQDGKAFPKNPAAIHWPGAVEQLKGAGSTVNKIYASFGGAEGATQDFKTIKTIYEKGANGRTNTFDGTALKSNLLRFRSIFHMIDGIDMDCEETYDHESFVAFCKLLRLMNFDITFCPYCDPDQGPKDPKWHELNFWTKALKEIEETDADAVKWWNLQCYAGGIGNDPQIWAQAIKNVTGRSVENYIIPGDWGRFWDPKKSWDAKKRQYIPGWDGHCPAAMTEKFSGFSKQSCVGGGFIWDLDLIAKTQNDTNNPSYGPACPGDPTPLDPVGYLSAMKKGLGL